MSAARRRGAVLLTRCVARPSSSGGAAAAPCVPDAPNARVRLKHATDARGLSLAYRVVARSGPPHAPHFRVQAEVSDGRGGPLHVADGAGPALRAAEEAAAATLLVRCGWAHDASPARREAEALLGDAALDLLLALDAVRAGLDSPAVDALRQRLLCNASLGRAAPGRAAATTVEAVVGRAVLRRADALHAALAAAAAEADPELARAVADGVREAVAAAEEQRRGPSTPLRSAALVPAAVWRRTLSSGDGD